MKPKQQSDREYHRRNRAKILKKLRDWRRRNAKRVSDYKRRNRARDMKRQRERRAEKKRRGVGIIVPLRRGEIRARAIRLAAFWAVAA